MKNKYTLLACTALIWGSQFLFADWILKAINPDLLGVFRTIIGAVCLTVLLLIFVKEARCTKLSRLKYWPRIFCVALFDMTLPFILIGWGQQHINSALTSILIASVVIFATILVVVFVPNEKITFRRLMGVLIGFIAIIILFLPECIHYFQSSHHSPDTLLGELAVLGGSLSFSISLIMIRRLHFIESPIRMARDLLSCSAVQFILITLFSCYVLNHSVFVMPINNLMSIPLRAWVSIGILGVFAGAIVYLSYIYMVRMAGASFASMANYFVPIIGVLLGVFINGDLVTWNIYLAGLLLVIAMIIA